MGIAGIALEQAIPLGRVWSFPKNIVIPHHNEFITISMITDEALEILEKNLKFTKYAHHTFEKKYSKTRIAIPIQYA